LRMPQTRIRTHRWASLSGFKCQISSTSCVVMVSSFVVRSDFRLLPTPALALTRSLRYRLFGGQVSSGPNPVTQIRPLGEPDAKTGVPLRQKRIPSFLSALGLIVSAREARAGTAPMDGPVRRCRSPASSATATLRTWRAPESAAVPERHPSKIANSTAWRVRTR
jgi:hypothetical protein